jgi:4-hydroxy-tetrahydrodipicolinate reductase
MDAGGTAALGRWNSTVALLRACATGVLFASGALRAAEWLQNQPPGLFSMRDVLGFE